MAPTDWVTCRKVLLLFFLNVNYMPTVKKIWR